VCEAIEEILDFGFWILDFGFWTRNAKGKAFGTRQKLSVTPTVEVLDCGLNRS
jgi:hypothetical protein